MFLDIKNYKLFFIIDYKLFLDIQNYKFSFQFQSLFSQYSRFLLSKILTIPIVASIDVIRTTILKRILQLYLSLS